MLPSILMKMHRLPIMLVAASSIVFVSFGVKAAPFGISEEKIILPAKPAAKPYPEKCVTVVGTASTDKVSEAFARQKAIRNALKQGSMRSNLTINSSQVVKDFSLAKDTTYFTSNSRVSSFSILKEGLQQPDYELKFDDKGNEVKDPKLKLDTYEVTLEVCLTEDPKVCPNLLGNHLQPRLAVAQVVTTDSQGATDISNLLSGYQIELDRRLRNLGYNNIWMLNNGNQLQPNVTAEPNLSKDILEPIRESTGAQYALLSVIRSTSGHNEDPKLWNDMKRFYNREVQDNARYIEVDSYVVDLVAYKIVMQKRHGFDIKGDVRVGRERPFGTNAFFATNTGMGFHAMLQTQVRSVNDFLKCKRVESTIIDIRDGEYVLFLSRESGAKEGDNLVVYHKGQRPVRYQGADLGLDSKPVGFLKIKRIHSKFAVAELVAKDGRIDIGDVVRTW